MPNVKKQKSSPRDRDSEPQYRYVYDQTKKSRHNQIHASTKPCPLSTSHVYPIRNSFNTPKHTKQIKTKLRRFRLPTSNETKKTSPNSTNDNSIHEELDFDSSLSPSKFLHQPSLTAVYPYKAISLTNTNLAHNHIMVTGRNYNMLNMMNSNHNDSLTMKEGYEKLYGNGVVSIKNNVNNERTELDIDKKSWLNGNHLSPLLGSTNTTKAELSRFPPTDKILQSEAKVLDATNKDDKQSLSEVTEMNQQNNIGLSDTTPQDNQKGQVDEITHNNAQCTSTDQTKTRDQIHDITVSPNHPSSIQTTVRNPTEENQNLPQRDNHQRETSDFEIEKSDAVGKLSASDDPNLPTKFNSVNKKWIVPTDLESVVDMAGSIVASEIKTGNWTTTQVSQAIDNQDDVQRKSMSGKKLFSEVSECDEETHLRTIASAIQMFAKNVILPSFMSARVGGTKGAEDNKLSTSNFETVLVAALMLLREVLALNADEYFFYPKYSGKKPIADTKNDEKIMECTPGDSRREKLRQDEENSFKSQLLSTAVVLSAIENLPPDVRLLISNKFLRSVRKYDAADEEFTSCLDRADGRSNCYLPNGEKLGREENVAWRISFNRCRENHPLLNGHKRKLATEQLILCKKLKENILENSDNSGKQILAKPKINLPTPNACFAYIGEVQPLAKMKRMEQRRAEIQRKRDERRLIQKHRYCMRQWRIKESSFNPNVNVYPNVNFGISLSQRDMH